MREAYTRRGFLRSAALTGGSLAMGGAGRSTGAEPDLAAMSLEQQVGQMVIARLSDWPLMEKYARRASSAA